MLGPPALRRYGHVIDELEDRPRIDAEEAIRQARAGAAVPSLFPGEAGDVAGGALGTTKPRDCRAS